MPTMRAAQVVEPRQIELVDVPEPSPGDGEVVVRLEGCGVCASNVPPFEGREWFSYPMPPGALGHESWGVVEAVGPGAGGLAEGDRVASMAQDAYAEKVAVAADQCVKLPDALAGWPFPGEPLACAMNIRERTGHKPGDVILLVGVGFLGALLTRLYRADGATVIATTRREEALAFADADVATPLDDHWRIVELVKEHTAGRGADVVVECTGKQWPLDLCADAVREMGRMVIAGYHQDGPRQVNLQTWNWKGLDVVNAHERDPARYVDGMKRAVAAAEAGRLDPRPLLTHALPLDDLADALRMTADRPAGFMKAWVRF